MLRPHLLNVAFLADYDADYYTDGDADTEIDPFAHRFSRWPDQDLGEYGLGHGCRRRGYRVVGWPEG